MGSNQAASNPADRKELQGTVQRRLYLFIFLCFLFLKLLFYVIILH